MTITITNSRFTDNKFIFIPHGSPAPTIIVTGTAITAKVGIEERDDAQPWAPHDQNDSMLAEFRKGRSR